MVKNIPERPFQATLPLEKSTGTTLERLNIRLFWPVQVGRLAGGLGSCGRAPCPAMPSPRSKATIIYRPRLVSDVSPGEPLLISREKN
jgi:hypothetical protein